MAGKHHHPKPNARVPGPPGEPALSFLRRPGAPVLALAALFFLLNPGDAAAQQPLSFSLEIQDGRVAPDKRTIRVKEGDTVEFRWTADRPLELHLHGYDVEIRVRPGKAGIMTVRAHTAGRFPIEIHGKGSHGNIVYLEVHPR